MDQNTKNGAEGRAVVLRETAVIALGELIGVAAMLGVFALAGHFDAAAFWGGICGGLLAILNFFLMAVNASLAMDKAAAQNVKAGQRQIKLSYTARLLCIFAVLFLLVKSGFCNPIAAVLPLVFVRPIITVAEFFRK